MGNDKVFRVFLDGRNLETVSRASESSIYVGNTEYLDTTAGGTSYAVLGWNNSFVNVTKFSRLLNNRVIDK